MPEVCASAAVYRRARPAAAATPRKGKILRRETNFDSISEVMFNLLDFRRPRNRSSALAYGADPNQTRATVGAGCSEFMEWRAIIPLQHCLTIDLLHRNRDVCVPGDVNLVTNLDLIEHGRIDDMSAVFPSVRTSEADRGCILVDSIDGRGHCSLHGCRAPRSFPLPRSGGPGLRIDRCLARRLKSRGDVVVIRHRYFVPDLELIEPLRACGHVDRLEAAIGFLDVHGALLMIDGCHGARKGDRLCRELFDLLRPAGQGKSDDQRGRAQDCV